MFVDEGLKNSIAHTYVYIYMAINHTIGQNLRHIYNFCYSMTKGNVWTWAHINHKAMHIDFTNLKNPNILGALGVWCKV